MSIPFPLLPTPGASASQVKPFQEGFFFVVFFGFFFLSTSKFAKRQACGQAAHAHFGRQGEALSPVPLQHGPLWLWDRGPSFSLVPEFSEGPGSHPGSRTCDTEKPSGPHFDHLGYTQATATGHHAGLWFLGQSCGCWHCEVLPVCT